MRVQKGFPVKVSFESLSGKFYQGKVSSLFPRQGDFIAVIDVAKLPANILPGMTADVSIEVGEKKDVLLVPISSVESGRVLRKRDGRKKKVRIEVGITDGNRIEVTSGDLKESDLIYVPKVKEKS